MPHQKVQRIPRIKKRVSVKFGPTAEMHGSGMTTNISARGIGIQSPVLHPVGTRLLMSLHLPGDKTSRVTGTVSWGVRGITQLSLPGSMGIHIESADEAFFKFLAEVSTQTGPEAVHSPSRPVPAITRRIEHPRSRPPMARARPATIPPRSTPAVSPAPLPESPGAAVSPAKPPTIETPIAAAPLQGGTPSGFARPNILPVRDPANDSGLGQQNPRAPRIPNRAPVRLGTSTELKDSAFTTNISSRGIALSAKSVYPTGTRLLLEVSLPKSGVTRLSGVVMWAVRPIPALALPGSMGIRVESADEQFFKYLAVATLCAPMEVTSPRRARPLVARDRSRPPARSRPGAARSRPPAPEAAKAIDAPTVGSAVTTPDPAPGAPPGSANDPAGVPGIAGHPPVAK